MAAKGQARSLIWPVVRFVVLLPILSLVLGLLRADRVFTPLAARLSGAIIQLFSADVAVNGSVIQGKHFGVNIYYGCDAEDVIMLFAAAVLAFPRSWPAQPPRPGGRPVPLLPLHPARPPRPLLTG